MAQDPDCIKTYHPFDLITVIQDGDLQLFESRAIFRYIIAKFGASSSLGVITSGDPIMIAKFEKALSIGYSYVDPSVRTLCNENSWNSPAEAANSLELEKAPAMFKTALDYYEDLLGFNSLADIYVFTWMPYIKFLGLYDEVAAGPNFEGLWKRVSTRPPWQKVLRDMPQ
ncbi:Glutathione S-transferase [Colletotrichum gloeosporioides]|uniref:glutathione transferase n=1 Tax=Colletotrichum gloeosporioides TaxID=474922 RepID=A0A8H4CT86_COLGL|nr:Glutathione S-transferase [Colletotrichum gloeosporioides]KAF3809725.1 Glutathione S-transferase [Colletotrichum gloeosporioides]